MRMRWLLIVFAIVAPGSALAQTKTAQFAVRAQVVADCQITAQDLNFGTYRSDSAATASTTLTLRCTPGSAATVSLDGGGSGNPQARSSAAP
ncbi:MAG: hypothetical protein EON58_02820, partial [Alphaproteobacteria bacterium]